MPKPEPLYVPWRGREVRIRHDDPTLRPYWPNADRLRAAILLATDVEGLRHVLATTLADEGSVGRALGGWPGEARPAGQASETSSP